jgi:hypothetical protein
VPTLHGSPWRSKVNALFVLENRLVSYRTGAFLDRRHRFGVTLLRSRDLVKPGATVVFVSIGADLGRFVHAEKVS